jgi:hypothetical protein
MNAFFLPAPKPAGRGERQACLAPVQPRKGTPRTLKRVPFFGSPCNLPPWLALRVALIVGSGSRDNGRAMCEFGAGLLEYTHAPQAEESDV